MKNRKRGFSLVELLIVLAVIAALIATITPVALNAIRKSQATKVAQNIKTLASAFENAIYVNDFVPDFDQLGRDLDPNKYGLFYTESGGSYDVAVITSEEADLAALTSVVADIRQGNPNTLFSDYTPLVGVTLVKDATYYYYSFTFDKY